MRLKKSDLEKAGQVKAILEKEYYKHYTYHELAHMVNTNVLKLQVAFKVITAGTNIYEYLTLIRVQRAMLLLETTELTVETIADKVGLDKTNLNKQFKKMTGTTPYAWRLDQDNKDGHYGKSG